MPLSSGLLLGNCMIAYRTSRLYRGIKGYSYHLAGPTPQIPTILLDTPGFFQQMEGHFQAGLKREVSSLASCSKQLQVLGEQIITQPQMLFSYDKFLNFKSCNFSRLHSMERLLPLSRSAAIISSILSQNSTSITSRFLRLGNEPEVNSFFLIGQ